MDEKTQITDNKSHVTDSKKALNNNVIIDEKELLGSLYKKTEKLATATYLITDFFSETEPLRIELRARSLSLLSFMGSFAGKHKPISSEQALTRLSYIVYELISLYEIAVRVRMISQMNFMILRDEYQMLADTLIARKRIGWVPHDINLSERFFANEHAEKAGDIVHQERRENLEYHGRPGDPFLYKGHEKQKDNLHIRHKLNIKDDFNEHILIRHSSKNDEKTARKTAILNLLKAREKLSIRDISFGVGGCSEKTIQRDLMSLIGGGLIERRGERRWSTYSLKK